MDNEIQVTVLIENTSDGILECEHGLSFFIEYRGMRMLLDAGSSGAFMKNAENLGISLSGLDAYVLSHGHYDHSGGFESIFLKDPKAKVYARKEALGVYLSGSGGLHEISVPQNVKQYSDRFIFTEDTAEILPGIYLVPHKTENLHLTAEKNGLYKKQDGKIISDDFAHEQSLVINTEKGLVIFNSCSHGGAVNIIGEAKKACGQKQVYAYIGGLHMKGKENGREICSFSEAEINKLSSAFLTEDIRRIYTGHCTGTVGFEKLKSLLGNRIHRLTTGMRFSL